MMRLTKIKILHFGQLSNLTFTLPSRQLNVFFGANEAGKSTTVAFIKQVLFGFYLRTNSSPFFEDYQPLAHVSPMGGSLFFVDEQKHQFELQRLWAKGDKSKRGSLTVKRDGQVVPPALFFKQIQQIDGQFYTDSFIFNQEMLGRVASLSQEDLLERIYYLGAANSGQLLDLRDEFNKEADQLFKKTGRKPPVNVLLKKLTDQRAKYEATEQQFASYRQLRQALEQEKKQLQREGVKLTRLQDKQDQLRQLNDQLQNYQQWQKLKQQRENISFDQKNYQQAQSLAAQISNLQAEIASLTRQKEELKQDKSLDFRAARELLWQRTDVLSWQQEYQTQAQKERENKEQANKMLAAEPELTKISHFSADQIASLRADYQAISTFKATVVPADSNPQILFLTSGLMIVFGFLALKPLPWLGLLLLIGGAGLAFYAGRQKRRQAQKAAKAKQEARTHDQQEAAFRQKYHLDPATLDLRNLLLDLNRYQLLEEDTAESAARRASRQRQLDNFRQQLSQSLGQPIKNNFSSLRTALDLLAEKLELVRQQNQHAQALAHDRQEKQANLEKLQLELRAVLAADQVQQMKDYDQRYQQFLAQTKLETQIEALGNNLGPHLPQLKALSRQPGQLTQEEERIRQEIEEEKEKEASQQNQIAQKEVRLQQLADSTTLLAEKQNLANTEAQLKSSSEDYLADLMAAHWLNRTLDLASNERFPKMLIAAKKYLNLLTGGRYVDLVLAKKVTVIRADGRKMAVKYLSRGTAEQLYFALKLAFVEQIKDQINLPILIDDSFVNFDDRRLVYIEQLLRQISRYNQVLIFTAQSNLVTKLGVKALKFRKEEQNA